MASDVGHPQAVIEALLGAMLARHRALAKTWANQAHPTVAGGHFFIEDAADDIGIRVVA